MSGKLLISLFAGLLLAGCAGVTVAEEVVCEPVEMKDSECRGDRHYPIVTINTVTKEIAPEFVCAARDSVIEFRVVPPSSTAVGAVAVKAKDPLNTWLVGTNYPHKKMILVPVPGSVEKGSVHEYNIFFDEDRCIDPRVHVDD